jgi:hypothetical protein
MPNARRKYELNRQDAKVAKKKKDYLKKLFFRSIVPFCSASSLAFLAVQLNFPN